MDDFYDDCFDLDDDEEDEDDVYDDEDDDDDDDINRLENLGDEDSGNGES